MRTADPVSSAFLGTVIQVSWLTGRESSIQQASVLVSSARVVVTLTWTPKSTDRVSTWALNRGFDLGPGPGRAWPLVERGPGHV